MLSKLTVEKKLLVLVLPFLGSTSFQTWIKLKKSLKNTLNYCKLQIVFKIKTRLSNTFHFKDWTPKDLTSGVVYKFQYGLCIKTYYGQCVSEHIGISPFTKKQVKMIPSENFGIIKGKPRQKPKPNSSHFWVSNLAKFLELHQTSSIWTSRGKRFFFRWVMITMVINTSNFNKNKVTKDSRY